MVPDSGFYWGMNLLRAEGRLYSILETYPTLDLQLAGFRVGKIFTYPHEDPRHCGLLQYVASVRKTDEKGQVEKAFLAVASRPLHCSSQKSFVDSLLVIQRWARSKRGASQDELSFN